MDYTDYLYSEHWQRTRLRKLRQGIVVGQYQLCTDCRCLVSLQNIHVHHLPGAYARLWNERDEDLQILCAGCHAIAHQLDPPQWWLDAKSKHRAFSQIQLKRLLGKCLDLHKMTIDEAIHASIVVLAPRIGPAPKLGGAERLIGTFIEELFRAGARKHEVFGSDAKNSYQQSL